MEIKTSGNGLAYYVTIVERQAMRQDVAANTTEEGRATNRRVELVAQP